MREIKFRMWDGKRMWYGTEEELKEWSEWFEVKTNPCNLLNSLLSGYYNIDFGDKDNKYVWMQYTGLRDMNGKEIYEGDVVAIEVENWEVDYPEKTKAIGVVSWDDDCSGFYIQWFYSADNDDTKNYIDLCPWVREQLEVIGNVFENTDLIEGCVEKEWRVEQKIWKENFLKKIRLLKGDKNE